MSDMVQKLEQEKSTPGRARCNLSWFMENIPSRTEPFAADRNGPTKLKIGRPIEKKVELWERVSFTKKDATFELVATYPEGADIEV